MTATEVESFDRLAAVMARLRAPDGCPWDREQSHESLREYLLEETYEVLEAIDAGDPDKLCEELGDLLLQIVFHAQLAGEAGAFDLDTICSRLNAKLIQRHPHVFGTVTGVERAEQVLEVWEQRKRAESGHRERSSQLDGIPLALPALARSHDLQRRAAKVGFEWPDLDGRLDKLSEEVGELAAAAAGGPAAEVEAEFGDVLFVLVNIGRTLGLQAEDALHSANARFEARFRAMEQAAGGADAFAALDLAGQDRLWHEIKRRERDGATWRGEAG